MSFRQCLRYFDQDYKQLADRPVLRCVYVFSLASFLYLTKWPRLAVCWILLCALFQFLILYPIAAVLSVGVVLSRLVVKIDPGAGKRWGPSPSL